MRPSASRRFPPEHTETTKGHGRIEIRRIWTSTALADYLDFPHAAQVFRVARHTTDLHGARPRTEVVYGVTSFAPAQASPARLLALNRGHWTIESRLHWARGPACRTVRGREPPGAHPPLPSPGTHRPGPGTGLCPASRPRRR